MEALLSGGSSIEPLSEVPNERPGLIWVLECAPPNPTSIIEVSPKWGWGWGGGGSVVSGGGGGEWKRWLACIPRHPKPHEAFLCAWLW
jgi:hypothetical protein